MEQHDNAAVLERAKALANEDGFAWELDFGTPGTRVRGQHFLSKERQQEYLERGRLELRKEAKVFEDRINPGDWRVETIDDDGGIEVAIFGGPNARERALRYAEREYGEFDDGGRHDPDGKSRLLLRSMPEV